MKNLGHCTPDQKSEDGRDGRNGRTKLHVDLGAPGKNYLVLFTLWQDTDCAFLIKVNCGGHFSPGGSQMRGYFLGTRLKFKWIELSEK